MMRPLGDEMTAIRRQTLIAERNEVKAAFLAIYNEQDKQIEATKLAYRLDRLNTMIGG